MSFTALDLAKRVRRSTRFKDFIATPRRLVISLEQRRNNGVFSIEIHAVSGLFAVMQTVLFILVHCEKHHLVPNVIAKGGVYGDETGQVDWFGRLFNEAKPSNRNRIRTSRIKGVEDLGFRSRYESQLSLAYASTLFHKYFAPRADIVADVDAICGRLCISQSTLAVHYRGSDKIHEAGRIPWDFMCERVAGIIADNRQFDRVLLASDEAAFIDYFQGFSFGVPTVIAPASYLATGNVPVHFSGHPGLAIGREALLTSLLLARCGFLIKTASYLSGWSKVFNPALPTWLVSPLIGESYFPDRALWEDQISGKAGLQCFGIGGRFSGTVAIPS